jgi:O-antigen ligase
MQFWLLLTTAIVPLALAPGLLSAYDITPKIAILLFCESAMLLFCKQLVNGVRTLLETMAGKLYLACLSAQFLSLLLSTIWSSNPMLSLSGSSWRRDGLIAESAVLLFAFMAAAWFVEDPQRIPGALRAAVVAGAIASLYGIAQYFGWDPLLLPQSYQSGEGPFTIVRPPGTLGHADYFANWLVIVTFLALALSNLVGQVPDLPAAYQAALRWKKIARTTMALATVAIVLSGTRSALLGLVVGALVARPRLNRKGILTLAAGLVCLGTLYISPAGAKLRARVHWSLDDVRGGARLLLWKDSLHMAMQHPLLGYGPETFTAQFPPFESVQLSRAYPDFYHESPHNMFLDALTSRGLPGMLSVLALCVLAAWATRKKAALAGALAGAVLCQQFMVLTVPTALYFNLLIAIIIATIPSSPRQQLNSQEWSRWSRRFRLPAILVAIIFLTFATRLLLADHAMARAERFIASGDVSAATKAYRAAKKWQPATGDADLRYSRAMTRLATTSSVFAASVAAAQQASDAATRATESAEDRQNAWYNFATIAALRNDRTGVENGLRNAIKSAPNWFKPHWTLAQFLELTGRHQEARQEAAIALELNGGHDPEVTETCSKILSRP